MEIEEKKKENSSVECQHQTTSTTKHSKEPKGLINIGCTCFMNAILQCLFWTPMLKEVLMQHTKNVSTGEKNVTQRLLELVEHVEEAHAVDLTIPQKVLKIFAGSFCVKRQNSISRDKIERFLAVIRQRNKQFEGYNKQDSFEMFNTIVSEIEEETKEIDDGEHNRLISDAGNFSHLFGGMFITVYSYSSCNHTEAIPQRFTSICIPVFDEQREERVVEKIKNNTCLEAETLKSVCESSYFSDIEIGLKQLTARENFSSRSLPCNKCKQSSENGICYKTLMILAPPPILVLQLNRFKVSTKPGELEKIQANVTYPEVLDMSSFVSRAIKASEPDSKRVRYSLYGVVCHRGDLRDGHYYAYIKTPRSLIFVDQFLKRNWTDLDSLMNCIKEFWLNEKKEKHFSDSLVETENNSKEINDAHKKLDYINEGLVTDTEDDNTKNHTEYATEEAKIEELDSREQNFELQEKVEENIASKSDSLGENPSRGKNGDTSGPNIDAKHMDQNIDKRVIEDKLANEVNNEKQTSDVFVPTGFESNGHIEETNDSKFESIVDSLLCENQDDSSEGGKDDSTRKGEHCRYEDTFGRFNHRNENIIVNEKVFEARENSDQISNKDNPLHKEETIVALDNGNEYHLDINSNSDATTKGHSIYKKDCQFSKDLTRIRNEEIPKTMNTRSVNQVKKYGKPRDIDVEMDDAGEMLVAIHQRFGTNVKEDDIEKSAAEEEKTKELHNAKKSLELQDEDEENSADKSDCGGKNENVFREDKDDTNGPNLDKKHREKRAMEDELSYEMRNGKQNPGIIAQTSKAQNNSKTEHKAIDTAERWYYISDWRVEAQNAFMDPNAYILMYERIE